MIVRKADLLLAGIKPTFNLISGSAALETAWSAATGLTVTDNAVASPRGPTEATRVQLAGADQHQLQMSFAQIDEQVYTLSVYAKILVGTPVPFQMAYYNGTSLVASENKTITADWARYSFTFTAQIGVVDARLRLIGFANGDDGEELALWGAQLEVGAVASPYRYTL